MQKEYLAVAVTKLLLVGPLPPPVVGTCRSFELFCEEITHYPGVEMEVVDSSAKRLKQATRWFAPTTWAHAWRVARRFLPGLKGKDCVLIFATYGFLLSMGPVLVCSAKAANKPCYVRAFAGSLDRYYEGLPFPLRWLLLTTIKRLDGLIVETTKLYEYFRPLLGDRVHFLPNYRRMPPARSGNWSVERFARKELRLLYVASVKEDKGIFVLLDSLEMIATNHGGESIRCDIYGPIHPEDEARFHARLSEVHCASYKGVLDSDSVLPTMQQYDALVLPTYHRGEGHPGSIIETMIAGLPVIATDFRSIPELVQDRVNGLLVAPRDPASLAQAIMTAYQDRDLLRAMAVRNYEQRDKYDVRHFVSRVLPLLGVFPQTGHHVPRENDNASPLQSDP